MGISRQMILTPGLLLRKSQDIQSFLTQNSTGSFAIYGSGRMALLYGLKLLGLTSGDNVVLPAYICDSATYPLRNLGIEMRFHKILPNLEPDIADLESLIDKKTKAILGVNYFGFPQRLDILSDICRRRGCFFIEDNAHGFLSRKGSKLLGTFGDIGIASIWKTVPAPNGGVLFVNNEELRSRDLTLFSPVGMSVREGSFFLLEALRKYLRVRFNFPPKPTGNIYPRLASKLRGRSDENNYQLMVAPFRVSLTISSRVDFEEVIRIRRLNYSLWQEKIATKKGLRSAFKNLPEGVCPQFFPIVTDDSDSFLAEMGGRGIPVSRWPPLPEEVKDNKRYVVANFLAEYLFILPVHQYLDSAHLKNLVF